MTTIHLLASSWGRLFLALTLCAGVLTLGGAEPESYPPVKFPDPGG